MNLKKTPSKLSSMSQFEIKLLVQETILKKVVTKNVDLVIFRNLSGVISKT